MEFLVKTIAFSIGTVFAIAMSPLFLAYAVLRTKAGFALGLFVAVALLQIYTR
jgi:predicted MFS family arabinose efflux permease